MPVYKTDFRRVLNGSVAQVEAEYKKYEAEGWEWQSWEILIDGSCRCIIENPKVRREANL